MTAKQRVLPATSCTTARAPRVWSLLAAGVIVASLSSCGWPRSIRAHSHGEVASTVAARIKGDDSIFGMTVNIECVDGVRVNEPSGWRRGPVTEVEVLAGHHCLEVSFKQPSMQSTIRSTSNAVLDFEAEGGKTYLLHAAIIKDDFWTEVGKGFGYGTWRWTAWLVDESTSRIVAGRDPGGTTAESATRQCAPTKSVPTGAAEASQSLPIIVGPP